ncbi:lumican [Denticeps clupeoides]|uniref:Lumican n=1 Tax=Denticeps clupeoides TaxID=299321 RepID=A0AAY4DK74_9TELE|nr:lumican [Denticeps clupeoides]
MLPFRLPLLAAILSLALCQYDYDYNPSPQVGPSSGSCPAECECPYNFPTAMYCNDREMKTIPFVPTGIKYVYLQNNHITEIKAGVFDNVTDLLWLILDHNQITSNKIEKGSIDKLTKLEMLHISNNNLTEPVVPNSKAMKELKIIGNQLTKFPASTLSGMENLTSVYLSKNQLSSDSLSGAFKGLKSLILLDISENKMKKLPSGMPSSLLMLYADHNEIDSVPAGYLNKLPSLQYLRMSYNKLQDSGLPAGVFNVSSLLELDLSYNKLKKIPEVGENLEHLYLQVNNINKFDVTSFCKSISPVSYSKVKDLRLDGNNLTQSSLPYEASQCLPLAAELIID